METISILIEKYRFEYTLYVYIYVGFPGGSDGKESAFNAGDLDSIPGSRRSPQEGNGNPLHTLTWRISWTEEPAEATVHGVAERGT